MTADQTPTTRAPAPGAARPKRWPKVLLALSLTLNLAVIGMVLGAHYRDGRDAMRFPPPERTALRDTGVGPFFDAMSREQRGRMGQALRDRAGGVGPDRAALAEDLRAMVSAIKAEPYDPAALEAVMAAQQARVMQRVDAGRGVLLAEIAAMSPAERAAFADRLETGFGRAMERLPH